MGDETWIQDRYLVLGLLGRGSTGRVFRVRDAATGVDLACKALEADPADADPDPGPAAGVDRLRAELRVLARLRHPNLARVHDLGVVTRVEGSAPAPSIGTPFLTSELVDGPTLEAAREELDEAGLARVVVGILRALAFVHDRGLLHGDLKTENVLLRDGEPVLIDLGLAGAVRAHRVESVSGTLATLSPERLRGEPVDGRSDLYALGATLFRCLAGRDPFEGTADEVVAGHLERSPPALEGTRSARLARLVRTLLEKDPLRRPRSARALLGELEAKGELSAGRPVEVDDLPEPALIGRDAVVAGDAAVVVVSGPHGSGKTRVLDTIRWRAQGAGGTAVVAPPSATGIAELLSSFVARLGTAAPCAAVADFAARLVAPTGEGDASPSPTAVREALARAVLAAGRRASGLVLLADDVDAGPPEWGEALVHLARALAQADDRGDAGVPRLVLAFRDAPAMGRLRPAADPHAAGGSIASHGLEPLDPRQTASLLAELLPGLEPTEELAATIHGVAKGSPAATIAAVRRLVAAGAFLWRGGAVVAAEPAARAEELLVASAAPGGEAIGAPTGLPRRIAESLAVIGRPADLEAIATSVDATPGEVRGHLLALVASRAIEPDASARCYALERPEPLRASIGERRCRSLHAAWLGLLERGALGDAVPAEVAARLAIGARDPARAAAHARRAEVELARAGAHLAAAELLEGAAGVARPGGGRAELLGRAAEAAARGRRHSRAAALARAALEALPGSAPAAERVAIVLTLARSERQAGDLDAARAALDAAAPAIDASRDGVAIAGIACGRAEVENVRGAWAASRDHARRGRERAADDEALTARLLNLEALACLWLGETDRAIELARSALDRFRKVGDRTGEANVLLNVGVLRGRCGDLEGAIAYTRAALEVASAIGDPALIASVHNNLGARANDRGELEAARASFRESLAIRERLGQTADVALTLNNLGSTHLSSDEVDAAEDWFERALALAESADLLGVVALARANLGRVRAARGQLAEALACAEESIRAREASGDPARIGTAKAELVLLELRLGRSARAATLAAEAAGLTITDPATHLRVRRAVAEVGALERPREAAAELAAVRAGFAEIGLVREAAEVGVALGGAHLALDEGALAARIAASADGAAAAIGARRVAASARAVEAQARLGLGELDRAVLLARSAASVAQDCGDPELLAEASLTLAAALERLGRTELARRERGVAARAAGSMRDRLPAELVETFVARPRIALALAALDEVGGQVDDGPAGTGSGRPGSLVEGADGAAMTLVRRVLRVDPEDETGILEAVLDGIMELAGASRGVLVVGGAEPPWSIQLVRDAHGRRPAAGSDEAERRIDEAAAVSRGVIGAALRAGEPILIADAQREARLSGRESVVRLALGSVIAAPIPWRGGHVGAVYLERPAPPFGERERDLVASLAAELAGAVRQGEHHILRERALAAAREELVDARGRGDGADAGPGGLIGRSAPMREVFALIERFGATELPVAIEGESGTGKELVARALHERSRAARGPFVAVDCGALSPTVIEAELFGVARGAFTGASEDRPGLIGAADGGTLFLDGIGALPDGVAAKLLRAIGERMIRPVGGGTFRHLDVRFVSATTEPLEALVADGRLRRDLYYRLAGVQIRVPPLRERADDVSLIVDRHVATIAERDGIELRVSRTAMAELARRPWPGNVRELRNTLERAALFASGGAITRRSLARLDEVGDAPERARETIRDVERDAVAAALRRHGSRAAAARALGISRPTLYRKMRAYDLQ